MKQEWSKTDIGFECADPTCMVELEAQLGVLIILKVLTGPIKELAIPFVMTLLGAGTRDAPERVSSEDSISGAQPIIDEENQEQNQFQLNLEEGLNT